MEITKWISWKIRTCEKLSRSWKVSMLETGLKTLYTNFKINLEKQPPELVCTKRCSYRFCKFHRKTPVLDSSWRSPWSLFLIKLQVSILKACNFIKKKDSNSCFPVKFVKYLRATDFKEHLRTTACESKPLRYIVFIKAMFNITSRGKVLSNYHLFLFLYSRRNFTILRNLFTCISVNNSFRKWEKPLLCYVVVWNYPLSHILLNLRTADRYLYNLFCKPRTTLGIVMKVFPSE